jgi:hypothetical protein
MRVKGPLRVQVGDIPWNEYFGHSQGIISAGASYDIWSMRGIGTSADVPSGALALYVDQAGYLQNHSVYRWIGGGLEFRQPLTSEVSPAFMPYIGAGAGVYRVDLHDLLHRESTRLGGKVFAGFEMRNGVFFEAAYNILGKLFPRDLSRLGVSIGYHF